MYAVLRLGSVEHSNVALAVAIF